MDNITKLYLGKKVMLDIGEVEQALGRIEEKIVGFLGQHTKAIDEYGKRIQAIADAKQTFSAYLGQIKSFYAEINKHYPSYLTHKLKTRMKELDSEIEVLKLAILK
jgi:hypothetical protein